MPVDGVVVWFSLIIVSVCGLTCFPCHDVKCPDPSTYDCSLGVVEKGCDCCYECAKGHGETCGGSYHIHGKCAEGLVCHSISENRITGWQGLCLTPDEAERYRSSTNAPGGITPPTTPPWLI